MSDPQSDAEKVSIELPNLASCLAECNASVRSAFDDSNDYKPGPVPTPRFHLRHRQHLRLKQVQELLDLLRL
jgi:hypothetical protein